MPRNKDLKRLVRARMSKTGESYTAARAHVIAKSSSTPRATPLRTAESRKTSVARAPRPDYAGLAGYSDELLKAKTGCTWERWVGALDYYGADKMAHRDIAALVNKKYKIEGWWSQAVTVGYERIKGLRARGQRRDGSYEANKSRTYNVPWRRCSARGRMRACAAAGSTARSARCGPRRRTSRCGWMAGTAVSSRSVSGRKGRRRAPSPCSTPSCAIRRRRRS